MEDSKPASSSKDYEILPENYQSYDMNFKVIIIGNSDVGKSCLSLKATKNVFSNNLHSTVGFEFFTFNIRYKDTVIKLQIWDTCGQEVYRALISSFFNNSSLAVIVYAINDINSFNSVEDWSRQLKNQASPDCKIFLIGNKNDLENERQVPTNKGKDLKEKNSFDLFLETSAKTGYNAQELFVSAAKMLYDDYISKGEDNEANNNDLIKDLNQNINKDNEKKKGCCN